MLQHKLEFQSKQSEVAVANCNHSPMLAKQANPDSSRDAVLIHP